MFGPILVVALKLILLTGGGYLLFLIPFMKRRLLGPLLFLTMNLLLPIYFIDRFSTGWAAAMESGWYWLAGFFAAFFVMAAVQAGIGALAGRRLRQHAAEDGATRRRILIALSAIHNAGFIPLPILEVIAPPVITVYMFMYVLAFNIVMWSVAVPLVTGEEKLEIKMNGPLVGVVLGLVIAASGYYTVLPAQVRSVLAETGSFGLDCVLVALGGILATIPRDHIRIEPELLWLGVVRFALYPAVLLLIAALVPLGALSADMQWGLRVSLVLQGVAPPATSLMLVAKSFGRESDVRNLGSGILFTYPLSFLLIPLFLLLSLALFR